MARLKLARSGEEGTASGARSLLLQELSHYRRRLAVTLPPPLGNAMAAQIPLSSDASALEPALDAARNDRRHEVVPDVAYRRLGIVNVVFCGPPQAGDSAY
jgi:hypothetical protein